MRSPEELGQALDDALAIVSEHSPGDVESRLAPLGLSLDVVKPVLAERILFLGLHGNEAQRYTQGFLEGIATRTRLESRGE